ncbi:MAG: lipid A-modifier LpxR family protein [Paracoccaceae bacterium]|uniref:lipid A-modifier LpxR family protein n=1 Tax=Seohaeicola saemankumensis TaxID=481181 RepID=UPI001E4B25AB|nr:lipid A-modifier LpxR family protein [Seohaeicola saemankumensis]MCD1626125.1 lipid A deacylase LpxR family protein [Seohaeicola saemankumensis]
MIRHLVAFCMALVILPQDVSAQARERIGYGRLISNDYLADGRDRWRTGSIASSRVWGRGWSGMLPDMPGDLLELRFGAEIIAPRDLVTPAAGDRPYAGILSAGLHTHFERLGSEFAVGANLVVVGPQTRLDDLQGGFHDLVGVDKASPATRAAQVGNGVYPTFVGEVGRNFDLSDTTQLRPFLEVRAGVETLARAGVDVTIGGVGRGGLMVRDSVSGQRYRAIAGDFQGTGFVLGGDIASVADSNLLPSSSGVEVRDARSRLRAGVHWQGEQTALFYGLTWLGKEFEGQSEGQLIGSVRLDFSF